jgi:hypothetical protein
MSQTYETETTPIFLPKFGVWRKYERVSFYINTFGRSLGGFDGCLTFHLHCITEKLKKTVWSCYLDIESSSRVHMDLRKQIGHDATKLNIFVARLWRTRKKKRQVEESCLPLDQIDWWKRWSGMPFHGALSKPFLKEFPAGRTEHLSRSSSSPEFLVVFETRTVLHEWIWLVQRFFQSSNAIWRRSRKDHSNLQD